MSNNVSVNDLVRIRKIINLIIGILESNINDYSKNNISEENKELINFLIGTKDNVVSIIGKLTNLLVKLIPLEEKINSSNVSIVDNERLTEDDVEILKNYIEKCGLLINKENH